MKIKNRLSLQFTFIFACILALAFGVLFWIARENRKIDFYSRLNDRALTTAELFLAQDNLTKEKFKEVQKKYPQQLPHEIVGIYNEKDQSVFIPNTKKYWSTQIINQVRSSGHLSYQSGKKQVVGIYYIDNSGNFVVLASAIDDYGLSKINQLLWILGALFISTLIVVFFLSRLFAQIALRPISRVILEVKSISASNLNQRVGEGNGKDEISELAIHFNNLLEHLEKAFEMQRSFVSNASHELRTPITSIIGEIEVTLSKEREVMDYQKSLHSIFSEAERLKDITDSLLDLAQANFDISQVSNSNLRIDDLLWELRDDWKNKLDHFQLELQFNGLPTDESQLVIRGNKPLLSIAINNVLNNAFKFSNNKKVICRLEHKEKEIYIYIEDQGIGISEKSMQHIFQPFFRAENAREFSGYGIGLSFTEKIISLHRGKIFVDSKLYNGTTFLIILPPANRASNNL